MINWKIIFRILGQLLSIEALLMLLCLVMSLCYGEDDAAAFITSVNITLAGSVVLLYFSRGSSNSMSRRDSFLVVSLVWVVFSLFGSLPFLISGYLPRLADAYFETMSGFSTTGATLIDDVERLPHALLFWRSMTQWIGGLGIVFFTIAILPSLGAGTVKCFPPKPRDLCAPACIPG